MKLYELITITPYIDIIEAWVALFDREMPVEYITALLENKEVKPQKARARVYLDEDNDIVAECIYKPKYPTDWSVGEVSEGSVKEFGAATCIAVLIYYITEYWYYDPKRSA